MNWFTSFIVYGLAACVPQVAIAYFGCDVFRVSGCREPVCATHQNRFVPCDKYNAAGCETIAVANGPGMSGVAPAVCNTISNDFRITRFVASPDSHAGVVALRDPEGLTFGTGILISDEFLLTAGHVIASLKKRGWGSAVFGHFVDRFGATPAAQCMPDFEIDLKNIVVQSPVSELDYAVVRMLNRGSGHGKITPQICDRGVNAAIAWALAAHPSPLKAPEKLLPPLTTGVSIVGYTDNVFFPRGLVHLFSGKQISNAKIPEKCELKRRMFYDLQTVHGISGSPVFNSEGAWVGMHLGTARESCADYFESPDDFYKLPAFGVALLEIQDDIHAQCGGKAWSSLVLGSTIDCKQK
jgi:hypothetical protein